MTTTIMTKFQQRRKFLLILPLLVIPFLFLVFFALGGGKGEKGNARGKGAVMGFNMELPPALFDKKEEKMDKLAFYRKADEDSIRRKEQIQQDPYHRQDRKFLLQPPKAAVVDTQTDALLRRLDLLKRRIEEPGKERSMRGADELGEVRAIRGTDELGKMRSTRQIEEPVAAVGKVGVRQERDTTVMDPELDRLNEMLDKIARLQKGGEEQEKTGSGIRQEQNSQLISVAVPATVDRDQALVNGATIALRLTSAVCYNGMTLLRGQLVYGVVTMNNDRMQVGIHSIRSGQSILTTAWQVYDMDGLPGIRIPDGLGRQTVRQSADQSMGALNLSTYDPSVGGQVAGAGIQAARNFLSRRVRTLRVMVPAGYQVLLKDTRTMGTGFQLIPDTSAGRRGDLLTSTGKILTPPVADSLLMFLHESASLGKVSLILRGIYQRNGLQWLYLAVKNNSDRAFCPAYLQCSIQHKRHLRRTAWQEVPVDLIYDSLPQLVSAGEEKPILIGLEPLLLSKDRQLSLQLGQKGSIEYLELKVNNKNLIKTRE